jgi:uncharacterized protein (TIGR02231 family)
MPPSEKPIGSKITDATIFLQGAQIKHRAEASLPAGETVLLLTGLSPYLDDNSVQVRGKGQFTILSVESRKNYLQDLDESEEVKTLKSKILKLEESAEDHQLAIGILKEKEAFLLANRTVSGKEESLDAAGLKALYDLYSAGIQQSRTEALGRERSLKEVNRELARLRQQLEESRSRNQQPSQEIRITVKAAAAVNAVFEISYFNPRASWEPSYDIRVDGTDKPVNMVYKARVRQTTGVDWQGVKLNLSNANPNRSGSLPTLYPYYLDFPVNPVVYRSSVQESRKAAPMAMAEDKMMEEVAAEYGSLALEVQVVESLTSTSFAIDVPYTIPSGGEGKMIDVMNLELPAKYNYQSIPKLDPSAFLVAGIHEWEQYDLLPGQSNIYFENTFVGQAYVNPANLKDTLLISLGRDQGVVVKREKRKDFTSDKLIGGNRVETRSWELSVRNTKSSAISLMLTDQVPVSNNKEIQIETTEISGGKLEPLSGKISWNLEIKPGETKQLVVSYSVKYPKDKNLGIQ